MASASAKRTRLGCRSSAATGAAGQLAAAKVHSLSVRSASRANLCTAALCRHPFQADVITECFGIYLDVRRLCPANYCQGPYSLFTHELRARGRKAQGRAQSLILERLLGLRVLASWESKH